MLVNTLNKLPGELSFQQLCCLVRKRMSLKVPFGSVLTSSTVTLIKDRDASIVKLVKAIVNRSAHILDFGQIYQRVVVDLDVRLTGDYDDERHEFGCRHNNPYCGPNFDSTPIYFIQLFLT